jgi:hypothetical protein
VVTNMEGQDMLRNLVLKLHSSERQVVMAGEQNYNVLTECRYLLCCSGIMLLLLVGF